MLNAPFGINGLSLRKKSALPTHCTPTHCIVPGDDSPPKGKSQADCFSTAKNNRKTIEQRGEGSKNKKEAETNAKAYIYECDRSFFGVDLQSDALYCTK